MLIALTPTANTALCHALLPRATRGPATGVRARRTAVFASSCPSFAAAALAYQRTRDLPRLLALWPDQWAALTEGCPTAHRALVDRLLSALRAERRRGRSGHWTYDLNRHVALKAAYRAECQTSPQPAFRPSGARLSNALPSPEAAATVGLDTSAAAPAPQPEPTPMPSTAASASPIQHAAGADIEITREAGIQIVRFTRADKKNAFTRAMYAAIVDALDHADRNDDIATTVLLGVPGAFSAGNDMSDFAARAKGHAEPDRPGSVSAQVLIRKLPLATKPIIAAVDGLAVGVGVTLLLHCDLVFASPNASFSTPFLNLGLVPEAASSLIGPQRLSYVRAFELLVLGDKWSAEQALVAGLVNAVLPSAELEARAMAAARALAAKPREALVTARRLLKGDQSPVVAMMDAETDAYKRLLPSLEAREAFSAFLEKRKPDFAKARAAKR